MFDENGNLIQGNNILSQLQAIQEGTMSPAGANPTMAPNGWLSNLLNLGSNNQGGVLGNLSGGGGGLLGLGQLGLGAIGSIGGLINSRNMLGLARDQFKHARDVTNTNLTNQIQSYNTALADRARNRAAMAGRDMESANQYIEENKLRR